MKIRKNRSELWEEQDDEDSKALTRILEEIEIEQEKVWSPFENLLGQNATLIQWVKNALLWNRTLVNNVGNNSNIDVSQNLFFVDFERFIFPLFVVVDFVEKMKLLNLCKISFQAKPWNFKGPMLCSLDCKGVIGFANFADLRWFLKYNTTCNLSNVFDASGELEIDGIWLTLDGFFTHPTPLVFVPYQKISLV